MQIKIHINKVNHNDRNYLLLMNSNFVHPSAKQNLLEKRT